MSSPDSLPTAAIFDMDGVLVDSNPYHLRKWAGLLEEHHIEFDPEELAARVLGYRNDVTFRHFFGAALPPEEMQRLDEELEEKFRKIFLPHARPMPGVAALIAQCRAAGISLAVASAAMVKNIEFIVGALGFSDYFRCLVSGDEVSHSKPHPETYLRVAQKLNVEPAHCVAFEDSFAGVESACRAGMKCVAIASTFPHDELRARTQAALVVRGFEELSLDSLRRLFIPAR
jgi:beta-phosphoglucomutase